MLKARFSEFSNDIDLSLLYLAKGNSVYREDQFQSEVSKNIHMYELELQAKLRQSNDVGLRKPKPQTNRQPLHKHTRITLNSHLAGYEHQLPTDNLAFGTANEQQYGTELPHTQRTCDKRPVSEHQTRTLSRHNKTVSRITLPHSVDLRIQNTGTVSQQHYVTTGVNKQRRGSDSSNNMPPAIHKTLDCFLNNLKSQSLFTINDVLKGESSETQMIDSDDNNEESLLRLMRFKSETLEREQQKEKPHNTADSLESWQADSSACSNQLQKIELPFVLDRLKCESDPFYNEISQSAFQEGETEVLKIESSETLRIHRKEHGMKAEI